MANLNLDNYKLQNNLDKYKTKTPQVKSSDFIDKVGEVGSQGGRQIFKFIDTVSTLGQKTLGKLVGVKKPSKLPEELTREAQTPAEKVGAVLGEGIQYLTPVGAEKAILKGGTMLSKVLANSPKLIQSGAKLGLRSAVGGAELAGKTALMGADKEEVKQAGIIGVAAPPVLRAAGQAAKFTFGEAIPAVISGMTGVATDTIKTAFKNPTSVAYHMSKKVIPLDVREKAIKSLNTYRTRVSNDFENGLEAISKLSPRRGMARTAAPEGAPGVFSGVKGGFKSSLETGTENLKGVFNRFRISIKNNQLNFDKLNSSIVTPAEQKQIQKVWDTILKQKDFSAKGVQDVAARINALSKYDKGIRTETSAVVAQIHKLYDKAIQKYYPELGKLRAEYSSAQQIISGIDNIIKSSKDQVTNPTTATTVSKKLVNLFQEDNEAYVRALRKLEQETGEDLINQFVAANFDRLLPGKLGSYIGQAGVVGSAIVGSNPWLFAVLPLFSPKLKGKTITGAGKLFQKSSQLKPARSILPSSFK